MSLSVDSVTIVDLFGSPPFAISYLSWVPTSRLREWHMTHPIILLPSSFILRTSIPYFRWAWRRTGWPWGRETASNFQVTLLTCANHRRLLNRFRIESKFRTGSCNTEFNLLPRDSYLWEPSSAVHAKNHTTMSNEAEGFTRSICFWEIAFSCGAAKSFLSERACREKTYRPW